MWNCTVWSGWMPARSIIYSTSKKREKGLNVQTGGREVSFFIFELWVVMYSTRALV